MGELKAIGDWLDEHLPELANRHNVPGVSVAVLAGDESVESAAGVLNQRTGVEVTTDSVFQIGSITKVWTATLVMQLVDEGLVELGAPVQRYLPDFRVADPAASAAITPRHLLCHTAGFDGDLFVEAVDRAIERYVAEVLPGAAQLFPAGHMFSYCNGGFALLGRLVEVLRGKPYAQALRDHLIGPLGLAHVATNADEAILLRAAVGHIGSERGEAPTPTRVWANFGCLEPAGSFLSMSARDLLAFARLHLRGGLAGDGTRLLSEASVRGMQQPQVREPSLRFAGSAHGLGWALPKAAVGGGLAHAGGTIGQFSYLCVFPERQVAFTVLTNLDLSAVGLLREIYGQLTQELAVVDARPPSPAGSAPEPTDAADHTRYVGEYESSAGRFRVEAGSDGELRLHYEPSELDRLTAVPPATFRLAPDQPDLFTTSGPEGLAAYISECLFLGDDGTGRARYLHMGQAVPRVR
jgi:CubicO group peptidase (beta-lactamase class C family)